MSEYQQCKYLRPPQWLSPFVLYTFPTNIQTKLIQISQKFDSSSLAIQSVGLSKVHHQHSGCYSKAKKINHPKCCISIGSILVFCLCVLLFLTMKIISQYIRKLSLSIQCADQTHIFCMMLKLQYNINIRFKTTITLIFRAFSWNSSNNT